ncbi:EpsG family protein [Peribacillus loiseleuriae]|uniref:Capsular biosynthesis protein n=1 Tax=Peribacillus loiseleuriae TaxID=1679170 RepID=A0A0K9H0Q3_9BACI|nr:EpsG family protein [Peribacillus loiseleuriae]KMY52473.1 capsular biosynthesis protein [Peribacillus loiseleuriae]
MGIFWMNLIVVYVSSFFARYFSNPIEDLPFVKVNKFFVFLSLLSLVLVAGLQKNIGDTPFYMLSYTLIEDSNLMNIKFEGDFGFNLYQSILHRISDDPQLLIFTTALITNMLIVYILSKYSRKLELSLYVYITLGMYTVSMNGIRQYLAAALIFTSTKYILNGDWKKFIAIILLASTVHQSALILIPIYFIVRREAWTKISIGLLFLSVLIAMGFNQFSAVLFSAIEGTQYSNYQNFSEGGANILRVAVTAVPLVIAYLGRERLRELWPKSDYIVNLTLLGFIFMVISTQNWIFARFNIYFGLYSLILISWILELFVKNNRKFVYFGLILFYFIYFYFEQVVALRIDYRSDYLNW